jgi:hypothetical protein
MSIKIKNVAVYVVVFFQKQMQCTFKTSKNKDLLDYVF